MSRYDPFNDPYINMRDSLAFIIILAIAILFLAMIGCNAHATGRDDMPPKANEFVPIDISQAYFGACGFIGVEDDPGHGHADTKIWVRWGQRGDKPAEFSPIMSRRPDVTTAIDDCIKWYEDVKKELAKKGAK